GRHDAAGPAPRGPEIHDRQPLRFLDLRREVSVRDCDRLPVLRHLALLVRTAAWLHAGPRIMLPGVHCGCKKPARASSGRGLPPRAGNVPMPQLPLDHIGIAVHSIAEALPLLELVTGGRGSPVERIEDQGVEVAFIGATAPRLELIEPVAPDSPVTRFLERRGPGLHHLAYAVQDVAAALESFRRAGIRLVD